MLPDGTLKLSVRHVYSSLATRTHDGTGSLDGGPLVEGTGTMRPRSGSVVAWEVTFSAPRP